MKQGAAEVGGFVVGVSGDNEQAKHADESSGGKTALLA
jgi:hypothetical protein